MQRRFTVGLTVIVIMTVAACSKSSTTPAVPSASQEPAATPTQAPAPGVAAYTAYEFGFDGPDTLPAGTSDITVENVGMDDHEMTIVRLEKHQDWTEEQIVAFIQNDPKAKPKWAPPVGVLRTASGPPVVAPGETASVVFMDLSSGQPTAVENGSLETGTYMFLCFLGKSPFHAGVGMVKKVMVT